MLPLAAVRDQQSHRGGYSQKTEGGIEVVAGDGNIVRHLSGATDGILHAEHSRTLTYVRNVGAGKAVGRASRPSDGTARKAGGKNAAPRPPSIARR